MLQQMLHDDKEAEVREAVVRSLGLIIGFVSDPDKYQQVRHIGCQNGGIRCTVELKWFEQAWDHENWFQ